MRRKNRSVRLQNWNYNSKGIYLITVCTKHRVHYFGKIEKGRMILSDIGEFAQNEWLKTPFIRPDMKLELGDYVVMPDHLHLILIINENIYNQESGYDSKDSLNQNHSLNVQKKNVGSVIRGFKSAVTSFARKNNIKFEWQPLYWEHLIRSETELAALSSYIRTNPANWGKKMNPLNSEIG